MTKNRFIELTLIADVNTSTSRKVILRVDAIVACIESKKATGTAVYLLGDREPFWFTMTYYELTRLISKEAMG